MKINLTEQEQTSRYRTPIDNSRRSERKNPPASVGKFSARKNFPCIPINNERFPKKTLKSLKKSIPQQSNLGEKAHQGIISNLGSSNQTNATLNSMLNPSTKKNQTTAKKKMKLDFALYIPQQIDFSNLGWSRAEEKAYFEER